jgi:hypothetical protein
MLARCADLEKDLACVHSQSERLGEEMVGLQTSLTRLRAKAAEFALMSRRPAVRKVNICVV